MSDTSDITSDEEIKIPESRPLSGRLWKKTAVTGRRCKFGLVQEKNKTVEEKVRIRQEENLLRQMTKDNLARIERLREEKKERRRKNIQKQKEAELRSEVVQVIKNPAKLKRLKKKELRKIQKRDTLAKKKKKEAPVPATND
ncbi:unnamed protein product [Bemisia tabaci]|uniref:Coiled-coil domain-containing protein 86 n=1 Tax=Bemisia tabaci TaxID=7038 RepID=A0A9P0A747_BEMTA|nr:PREDICTED: coiled-coil domain-containing protein 86 [Bemisia tabaci]CAH0387944.1 unnamed protein product [Bemisia tabaci]